MEKDSTPDPTEAERTNDERVQDRQSANPAHPLPPADAGADSPAEQTEIDAAIEDRFEATDN